MKLANPTVFTIWLSKEIPCPLPSKPEESLSSLTSVPKSSNHRSVSFLVFRGRTTRAMPHCVTVLTRKAGRRYQSYQYCSRLCFGRKRPVLRATASVPLCPQRHGAEGGAVASGAATQGSRLCSMPLSTSHAASSLQALLPRALDRSR